MGHEASGVIGRVGNGVTEWVSGDRVTFDSTVYCGECELCRSGQINLCERRRVLGVSCEDYRQDGALAEFVAVPQRILHRLPQTLAFEIAALVEPYAIALHAVGRAKMAPKSIALVVGAGMIGLAIVQCLKHSGCEEIIVVDVASDRLAVAEKCGASAIINSGEGNALKAIFSRTQGRGVDVAFEAVGITATVDLSIRALRRGGVATLVGNVAPKIDFPLQIAVTRELTVLGSCASRGEYPACIDLLSRGVLNPLPLIGAIAPLSQGAEWFARLQRKEPGLLKVILQP